VKKQIQTEKSLMGKTFVNIKDIMKQNNEEQSDPFELSPQERNAIFVSARKVLTFPMDFHHMYLSVMMRDPHELGSAYRQRVQRFYDFAKAESQEPTYFTESEPVTDIIWATTISGTSECAYVPEAVQNLGRLLSVPNYDRTIQKATGKLVYTKKVVSNNVDMIRQAFDFEAGYKNDQKYSMLPDNCPGYNSNSFIRGVIEYMRIPDKVILPNCFKVPGFSKVLTI
jgi:hypothetical protein